MKWRRSRGVRRKEEEEGEEGCFLYISFFFLSIFLFHFLTFFS